MDKNARGYVQDSFHSLQEAKIVWNMQYKQLKRAIIGSESNSLYKLWNMHYKNAIIRFMF